MYKDLREILNNPKLNGRKDHYIADCIYCGKSGHFYMNINKAFKKEGGEYVNCWDCKKCSETGNLIKYLQEIGREDFIEGEIVEISQKLTLLTDDQEEVEETIIFTKEVRLPAGFKRIYEDDYLIGRRWTKQHSMIHPVGKTDILMKFKDRLIFSIVEKGVCRGYIARSLISKEEMKEMNRIREREGKKKLLRWQYPSGIDPSKLLFGYDELTFETKEVILVEGIFDKIGVDHAMNLLESGERKCLAKFGKSLNQVQVEKLKLKGIENIVLIEDPDAVNNSKRHSQWLKREFKSVRVGYTGDKDLGDSTDEEILGVWNNLETPFAFGINKVCKII